MTNPNESAYPMFAWGQQELPGLSKREYFAALAMQGLITRYGNEKEVAEYAVKQADQLITQLNKDNGQL